jgi:hypothetical protein
MNLHSRIAPQRMGCAGMKSEVIINWSAML